MFCYRAGHETRGLIRKSQGKGEDLKLACSLPWLEWTVGSQAVPVRGGVWEKERRWKRVIRSRRSVGSNGECGTVGREAEASILLQN